jgi:N utilization substance protein B
MASNRHLGRIVAMQTLYEFDFRGGESGDIKIEDVFERNLNEFKGQIDDLDFVRDIVSGVLANAESIDSIIAPAAPDWPVEQIARVDKTVLRVAVYELMLKRDVPPKVVINEAVEIAKTFGGENSSKFVNGVLGTIYRNSDYYEPEEKSEVEQPAEETEVESAPEQ